MTHRPGDHRGGAVHSRREVLRAGVAGVAAAAGAIRAVEARTQARPTAAPRGTAPTPVASRLNGPLFYDVETSSGVVRGMTNTGVKIFRGIPYGADTSGRNRFMPPRKPAAWTGARNCIGYGPISPQTASACARTIRS